MKNFGNRWFLSVMMVFLGVYVGFGVSLVKSGLNGGCDLFVYVGVIDVV